MSHPTRSIHAQAGLHRKLVLFGTQLELYLAHFPSHHKYVMAQQLRQAYVDVYNLVTEAQKRFHKRTTLTQLDIRHEQLRMLLLLAHELGLFNFSKGPIFERRYIATSFACRTGLGTHAAADWLQAAMRRAPRTAWTLHVDVRKFFYSVDRTMLAAIVQRFIKCPATLRLLSLFAQRPEPVGIPIGNLMSQTFANLYLHTLDDFAKRTLKVADYGRYMDDAVMIAPSRTLGVHWLEAIRHHLSLLGLTISHHSLQPLRRGLNWVGYRTWARARFVRPHLISAIRADARAGRLHALVSRLGHARRTSSHRPLITHLTEHHHALVARLPQAHHLPQHV